WCNAWAVLSLTTSNSSVSASPKSLFRGSSHRPPDPQGHKTEGLIARSDRILTRPNMRLGLSVFQLAIAAAVHFSPSGFAACSMEQRAFYISKVYEAAHGAASFRGTTALICNARIGNSLD